MTPEIVRLKPNTVKSVFINFNTSEIINLKSDIESPTKQTESN